MGRGRRKNSELALPNERRMAARKAVEEKREREAEVAAAAAAEGGGRREKGLPVCLLWILSGGGFGGEIGKACWDKEELDTLVTFPLIICST